MEHLTQPIKIFFYFIKRKDKKKRKMDIVRLREIFDTITTLDKNFYKTEYENALQELNEAIVESAISGSSPFQEGKTVESILTNGERNFFETIQEAIDDSFDNGGGNVVIHEKDATYNEFLVLRNNVNIHLEGNATIETNSANPSVLANGVNCIISGDGSIKNVYDSGTKYEAIRIVNGSNVIIKNDLISAIGASSSGIQGSSIYVNSSSAEIYSRYISNSSNVGVCFTNGASGKVRILKSIHCQNGPALYIDTNSQVEVENTTLTNTCSSSPYFNGTVVVSSSAALLSLKDVKIENSGPRSTDYGINISGTASIFLISGIEISTLTAESIYSASAQTILIRKPSWGLIDRHANITLSGFWSYTYG